MPTVEQLSEQITDALAMHFYRREAFLPVPAAEQPGTEFDIRDYLTEMRQFDDEVSPPLQQYLEVTGRPGPRWLTPAEFYGADRQNGGD